jgi:hypothetical protein
MFSEAYDMGPTTSCASHSYVLNAFLHTLAHFRVNDLERKSLSSCSQNRSKEVMLS